MVNVRKHVLIKGRVQGVWYRGTTQEQAQLNNVTGWARNTMDGHVEAVFEGDEADVSRLIQWCHEGPPLAHVTAVEVTDAAYTGEFPSFSIRA